MTFETIELSVDDGQPIELYEIVYSTEIWRYTTADRPVVIDFLTYEPLPIKRGTIAPTGDASTSNLVVELAKESPLGRLFLIQPPSEVITITIFSKHFQDAEFTVIWKGRITNCEFSDPFLKFNCESIFSSLQRVGIPRRFSVGCTHDLYGNGCRVTREAYRLDGVVLTMDGVDLTTGAAGALPDGYFAGGYMTWVHNVRGNLESRMIIYSQGDIGLIRLVAVPNGLGLGQEIKIYAGCDHKQATCHNKFGNVINFGGQPYIPQKNPFGGTTLY
jgi:uncharacterized phage protein (TIGR02218 family)